MHLYVTVNRNNYSDKYRLKEACNTERHQGVNPELNTGCPYGKR